MCEPVSVLDILVLSCITLVLLAVRAIRGVKLSDPSSLLL